MKRLLAGVLAVGLATLIGCDNSSTPGGPGASGASSNKKPIIGQADDTFTLSMPTLSTSIKQGETKSVTIGVKRGKNLDEDVSLKFEALPKGVTVEPASPQIKHGESEAKVSLKAADDAALGDFKIRVTGHPTKGTDASSDLSITVNKK
jgi:uncharacterized membrane protein